MRRLRLFILATVVSLGLSASMPLASISVAAQPSPPTLPPGVTAPPVPQRPGDPKADDAGTKPLSAKDCTITPRSRDDVVTILGTPPLPSGIHKPGDDSSMRPGGRPSTIDKIPVDDIQAAYRQWQVCKSLGATYQEMALETDQFIREDVYADPRTMTAYTEPTINELLDRREEADKEFGQMALAPGNVASMSPRAIDVNGIVNASEDGTYVFVGIVKVIDNHDGTFTFNPDGEMAFQLVDGSWKVDIDGQFL